MKLLIYIPILFIIIGCKKEQTFNHDDISVDYPCACCQFTDTLEGLYVGRLLEMDGWMGLNGVEVDTITDDSVSFFVTRLYDGTDLISDSLVCKFEIVDYFNEPIQFIDNSGHFGPQSYSIQAFYDSELRLYKTTSINQMESYTSFKMIAKKQ